MQGSELMAEGRMLKKRISKSRKFAELKNDKSKILYLMMLPHLDVEGRLEAEPDIIKADIIPLFKWPVKTIKNCLLELSKVGLIVLYKVDGEQYLEFTNFDKFQILRKDRESGSKIPVPGQLPEYSRSTPALSKDNISKDKKKYLEFVLLTDDEYKKLCDRFGKSVADSYIERLNNYLGSKGKKYKSHYHTILNWSNKDSAAPKTGLPPIVVDSEGKTARQRALEQIERLRNAEKLTD